MRSHAPEAAPVRIDSIEINLLSHTDLEKAQACYDPHAAREMYITLIIGAEKRKDRRWERMKKQQQEHVPQFTSTHPTVSFLEPCQGSEI